MASFMKSKPKPKSKTKRPVKTGPVVSRCRYCRERGAYIDYKDVASLQKMMSSQAKLQSRKRTGNCAFHQRKFQQAAKRARHMALVSYVA